MDRVFLDANVLISAAWRPDARVAQLWTLPQARLVTSTYAVGETLRHLESRERLERLHGFLPALEIIDRWSQARIPDTITLPEKDRPILQAAIAARSTHLITGDRQDFGAYFGHTVGGVEILLPAEYLASRL